MKRGNWFILLAFTFSAAMIACDKDDDDDNANDTTFNETDSLFVRMAAMSNFAEIATGQMAAINAEDSTVANYAEMMVTEHTTASQQLKTIANDLGLTAKDSLDAPHVMLMDSLTTLDGLAFDSAYVNSQVRDHQLAITLFQNEATNGENARLKTFATDMLPHLNGHLQAAEDLHDGLMD